MRWPASSGVPNVTLARLIHRARSSQVSVPASQNLFCGLLVRKYPHSCEYPSVARISGPRSCLSSNLAFRISFHTDEWSGNVATALPVHLLKTLRWFGNQPCTLHSGFFRLRLPHPSSGSEIATRTRHAARPPSYTSHYSYSSYRPPHWSGNHLPTY
jgi:hypothetical protein